MLVETKAYDEAMKQVSGEFPKQFEALAQDRRGDIYNLEGKKAEARAEYAKAYKSMDEKNEYRHLVEYKLASLGGDVQQPAAPAASGAAKQ